MTRKRRFTIFFLSAGFMSVFILFSLSGRQDGNIPKMVKNLFPASRAKEALLNTEVQEIIISTQALCHLKCFGITDNQLRDALQDNGDVDLMNDKTDVHKNPKVYFIEVEIGSKTYYVLAHAIFGVEKLANDIKQVQKGKTLINEFRLVDEDKKCDCQ
ncbi:MAG: hypothetical protein NT150_01915 [Bacteroidetes bacterium]|nr:hypothetical protein [Bacteroidota bacterium]